MYIHVYVPHKLSIKVNLVRDTLSCRTSLFHLISCYKDDNNGITLMVVNHVQSKVRLARTALHVTSCSIMPREINALL